MDIRKEEFPLAMQAYEVRGRQEDFVAEQVVSTQAEADNFMSLYAGRLIKTREVKPVETRRYPAHRRKNSSVLWIAILLIIAVLLIIGFATGWIQSMIGQAK